MWSDRVLLCICCCCVFTGSAQIANPFPSILTLNFTLAEAFVTTISVAGDHAASFGVATTDGVMAGPIVSCYVPAGNAAGALCTDADGNYGVTKAASQVSSIVSCTASASSWVLTVSTPLSRLGISAGSTATMMFAYTTWNSATSLPNQHTSSSKVQQTVTFIEPATSTSAPTTTVEPSTAVPTTTPSTTTSTPTTSTTTTTTETQSPPLSLTTTLTPTETATAPPPSPSPPTSTYPSTTTSIPTVFSTTPATTFSPTLSTTAIPAVSMTSSSSAVPTTTTSQSASSTLLPTVSTIRITSSTTGVPPTTTALPATPTAIPSSTLTTTTTSVPTGVPPTTTASPTTPSPSPSTVLVSAFPGILAFSFVISGSQVVTVINVTGNYAGSFGVAPTPNQMVGPIVSCYVPAGNATGALCTDADGNYGVAKAASQVSSIVSCTASASSWVLTVSTPLSRLGISAGSTATMMFAYTTWNSAASLPNQHTTSTRVQKTVAFGSQPATTNTSAPATTASPTSTPSVAVLAAPFAVLEDTLAGLISYNSSALTASVRIAGNFAGTVGFSASGMAGSAVSCYVPPGNAAGALCVDLNTINYDIAKSSSQLTRVVSVTSNSSVSVVTFVTPTSRFGSLASKCRMIYARTPFDTAAGLPMQHQGIFSDHGSLIINFLSGQTSGDRAAVAIASRNRAYIVVGVAAAVFLLLAILVSHLGSPTSPSQMMFIRLAVAALLVGMVAVVTVLSYQDFVDAGVPQPQYRIFGEASAFIFSLLLIPTTKHVGLGRLLGSSYERLIFLHPLLAFILIITMTTHMGGMFGMFENKSDLFLEDTNVFGFVAWVLLLCMALPAMFLRRKSFWFFRLTHCLFILVLLFAALHYDRLWPMLAPGCALWVLDVILRIRSASAANATVRSIRYDAKSGITSLNLSVNWVEAPAPGSYVFLLVPSISKLMHPFTVALCEARDPANEARRLATMYIKNNEGSTWTASLARYANSTVPLMNIGVHVFGPHGRLQVPLEICRHVVLVSGGIGVTPMLSIFEALAVHPTRYSKVEQVTFVWTARGNEVFELMLDTIDRYSALLSKAGKVVDVRFHSTQRAHHLHPLEPEDEHDIELLFSSREAIHSVSEHHLLAIGSHVSLLGDPRFSSDRPDFESLFSSLKISTEVGCYVCGPSALMSSVAECASKHHHWIHQETFEI